MASINPFYTEWQACLRAHYQHVLREQDLVTEPTLHNVLLETGVTETEIQRIRHAVLMESPVDASTEEIAPTLESELSTALAPVVEITVVESIPTVASTIEPDVVLPPEITESVPDALPEPILEIQPKPTQSKPPAQLSLF